MRTYFAAFVQALVFCVFLTPIFRRLAFRVGAVSAPGGRNISAVPTARLGGVGIALSILAPLLTLFLVDSSVAHTIRQRAGLTWGLLSGGLLLCATGAIDDARGLRATTKLAVQVTAALLAFWFGFRINSIAVPFGGSLEMGAMALPVTVVWIVAVTNAVNLIDGLDGLAAGVVFCAAVTNLIVCLFSGEMLGPVFVGLIMSSLMGALAGFLAYNFNPARIYMGDSGSYFLGFVLATCSVAAPQQKASTTVSLLVPMLALGLPLFDTLLTILRRWLGRRSIFTADRGHLHHRLLDSGLTHRRAVLTFYGVTLLLSAAAIAAALGSDGTAGFAILGSSVVLFGLVRAVRYLEHLTHPAHPAAPTASDLGDRDSLAPSPLVAAMPDLIHRVVALETQAHLATILSELARAGGFAAARLDHAATKAPPEPHEYRFDLGLGAGSLVVRSVAGETPPAPGDLALLSVLARLLGEAAKVGPANEEPVAQGHSSTER